ncbi:hypothetical protein K3495_g1229 [Podosphaera aphanis]|nr:hypothetical protein K3495_g1229 [Podosphaera aphanis]
MAVRRDTDSRDRRVAPPPTQVRSNEYFVPKDGIDREVITADICRYLGNDALVRPGSYENPSTGTVQQGFYITAYRNLTSAMIADLKTDSARWEQERRAATSRGNVGYTQSRTHESRQQWGPSGEATPGYIPAPLPVASQQGYDQYPPPNYPQAVVGSFGKPPPVSYMPQENHYIAGSNMALEQSRGYPPSAGIEIPRANAPQYASMPSAQQYPNQMQDPCYGRAPIPAPPQAPYPDERKQYYSQQGPPSAYGGVYDSRDSYSDRPYPEAGPYPPQTIAPLGTPIPPNSHRRERDRDLDMRDQRNLREHGRRR